MRAATRVVQVSRRRSRSSAAKRTGMVIHVSVVSACGRDPNALQVVEVARVRLARRREPGRRASGRSRVLQTAPLIAMVLPMSRGLRYCGRGCATCADAARLRVVAQHHTAFAGVMFCWKRS